jgi:hypothetical protein
MNRYLIAALPLALLSTPVLAGPDCRTVEARTPMWEVAKAFEEAGGVIRDMKVEDGCYEIKGEQGGVKLEIYFDPASGVELEREEI